MRGWHRAYWARSAGVRLALGQLGMAMQATPPDPQRVQHACTDLRSAVDTLASDPQALSAPQTAISQPLANAYGEIKAAANSCLVGRADDQAAHLGAARQAMAQATAALRPYQLQP